MSRIRTLLGITAVGTILGVAVAGGDVKTALDQIPAAARDALVKLADGAQITEVEREVEGGITLYEAEWVADGREAEATVTAGGDLVEMEEEIDGSALPPAVAAVVATEFPGARNLEYEKKMVVVYEIEAKVNGKEKEILVLPTGKILGSDQEEDDDD